MIHLLNFHAAVTLGKGGTTSRGDTLSSLSLAPALSGQRRDSDRCGPFNMGALPAPRGRVKAMGGDGRGPLLHRSAACLRPHPPGQACWPALLRARPHRLPVSRPWGSWACPAAALQRAGVQAEPRFPSLLRSKIKHRCGQCSGRWRVEPWAHTCLVDRVTTLSKTELPE